MRTTVHSDLINENDARLMIGYLETKQYTGDYYFQHFMNGVETIGKLEYSSRVLERETLSTPKIKVHFRG